MLQRSRFLGPIRALMTTPVRAKPARTGEPRENARSSTGPRNDTAYGVVVLHLLPRNDKNEAFVSQSPFPGSSADSITKVRAFVRKPQTLHI